MHNKKETKFWMVGRVDWSSLLSKPLIVEGDRPCEYKDYHLPGECNGPGIYGYGYGHIALICEAHYASAPDPRRIPRDWDGDPNSLLFWDEEVGYWTRCRLDDPRVDWL